MIYNFYFEHFSADCIAVNLDLRQRLSNISLD